VQDQVEEETLVIPEADQNENVSEEIETSVPETEKAAAEDTVADTRDNASMLYEQRQRQYLKGRYATRTITDDAGNVIISEGMMIDDGVIDEAKAKDKLIELVMNNKA
jgi:hypothetical protein